MDTKQLHRCWAVIDLAALERNLLTIRRSLPAHMRYVAVVKADAYGHGLHQVAARLMHAGADLFAVANIAEAEAIREVSANCPILLLGPLLPWEAERAIASNAAVSVSSVEGARLLDAAARAAGRTLEVHLKIDTGMGRAGVWHTRADAVFNAIRDAGNLRLAGVFTHFSSSDDDPEFTALQRRRFLGALKKGLPRPAPEKLLVHADNSAGLESIDTAGPFNAVRVGLLQFGVLPKPGALLSGARVEPVFSFHTRVGLVKRLPAGTDISYGRTRRLRRASTVAVLTAGYGDGLSRALSNRGSVLIGGRRRPILGRVTMDQTIVDVTDAPSVRVGDEAVLIGRQGDVGVSLAEFSEASGTIPWETLCSVTKRVPRIYKNSREV